MIAEPNRWSESHVRTYGRTDVEAINEGSYLTHPNACAPAKAIRLVVAR